MRILNLSLDSTALEPNSALAGRLKKYGSLVEKISVLVPSHGQSSIKISEQVSVFGSGGQKKWQQFLKLYRLAKGLLQTGGYDIITTQDQYFVGSLAVFLGKKFQIGVEVQVHGSEADSGIRGLLARFVIPRATSVRVVSPRLSHRVQNRYGVSEHKITVVPIYVPLEGLDFVRDYTRKETFTFLTVGRLVSVKHIEMQIEAMAQLVKVIPHIRLWIVGTGPLEESLKQLVNRLDLKGMVTFLGFQEKEKLQELYKQADAFLLTSWNEGWPRVIIEAGAYGLPIIMTDVGSAGDLVQENISGRVISVGDTLALSQAMKKLVEDEQNRTSFGKNIRKNIKKTPSEEQILNLYYISWDKAKL